MVGAFLEALWTAGPERGYLLVWTLDDKTSRWFQDTMAAGAAIETISTRDVYLGVGISRDNYGEKRRCTAKHILGIPGFWADVDIASPAHRKANLAKDQAEAEELISKFGRKPTILVHSGHGLQPWWLFKEPWYFLDDGDRALCERHLDRWNRYMGGHARAMGIDLDATQDLARILRIPGTTNNKIKDQPIPVRLLYADGPRYTLDELMEFAPETEPRPTAASAAVSDAGATVVLRADAKPDFDRFETLVAVNHKFKLTWERKRRDFRDNSPSAYCFSLSQHAAQAGWTPQEIVDLLIAWRRKYGEDLKLDRPDWYLKHNIQRALDLQGLEAKRETAYEELESPDDMEPQAVFMAVGRILDIPLVNFVQNAFAKVTYSFVLKEIGEIPIGGVRKLTDPRAVEEVITPYTRKLLPDVIDNDRWRRIVSERLLPNVTVVCKDEPTLRDDFQDKLFNYLSRRDELAWEPTEDLLKRLQRGKLPYVMEAPRRLYLNKGDFAAYMKDDLGIKPETLNHTILNHLRQLGFSKAVEKEHRLNNTRGYWFTEVDMASELGRFLTDWAEGPR